MMNQLVIEKTPYRQNIADTVKTFQCDSSFHFLFDFYGVRFLFNGFSYQLPERFIFSCIFWVESLSKSLFFILIAKTIRTASFDVTFSTKWARQRIAELYSICVVSCKMVPFDMKRIIIYFYFAYKSVQRAIFSRKNVYFLATFSDAFLPHFPPLIGLVVMFHDFQSFAWVILLSF